MLRAPSRTLVLLVDTSSGQREMQDGKKIGASIIVGHCFCVLPQFETQTGTLLSTLYIDIEVAVKKLGQQFFCHF